MFENLNELTKATQKQKIALQAMMTVGCVNWVNYADNGDIIVSWEDGNYGSDYEYRITRKGETSYERL